MIERITDLMDSISDDRVKEHFLMASLKPTLMIVWFYLVTAKIILPEIMKNRPALKLKGPIFYYNVFQVLLSAWIVYLGFGSGWVVRYSIFQCRDIDPSTTDQDAIMAMNAVYLYYLAKFSEFPDTIFFLLRKKQNQVSFLHMYHHASMPINAWFMAKLAPGGTSCMGVAVNSFVHVVMYSYYLMASLGPKWQKYLWWKKYLTGFQLLQFTFGLYQMLLALFGDCPTLQVYKPLFAYFLFYIASLLIMFGKFYNESYIKKISKLKSNTSDGNKPIKIN